MFSIIEADLNIQNLIELNLFLWIANGMILLMVGLLN